MKLNKSLILYLIVQVLSIVFVLCNASITEYFQKMAAKTFNAIIFQVYLIISSIIFGVLLFLVYKLHDNCLKCTLHSISPIIFVLYLMAAVYFLCTNGKGYLEIGLLFGIEASIMIHDVYKHIKVKNNQTNASS